MPKGLHKINNCGSNVRAARRAITIANTVSKPKYTLGIKGALDGDFDYHKLELGVGKRMRMGVLGYAKIDVNGSKDALR